MSSVQYSLDQQTKRGVASAAAVALVCIAGFALVIVALHALRPDLSPMRLTTSMYAVGPYGYLMTSAFLAMSLGSFALAVGLHRGIPPSPGSRVGIGLLVLWSVGLLTVMSFPLDAEGMPQTLSGSIHRIAGPLSFVCLAVGAILISRSFKGDIAWRPIHRSAVILSWLMLAGVAVTALSINTESGYAGLSQRLLLSVFVAWFLLTTARLRTVSRGNGA